MTTQKSEEIKVRLATLDDFGKLNYVYERDIVKHKQPLAKFPLVELIGNKNVIFPVAESKGKILGFMIVRLAGNTAKVDKLSVLKSYATKGLSKILISSIEPLLIGKEIVLYLPKAKSELISQFHTMGFKTHDEIKELFGKEKHGLMLKKLVFEKKKVIRKPKEEVKEEIVVPKTNIRNEIPMPEEKIVDPDIIEEADIEKYYFM